MILFRRTPKRAAVLGCGPAGLFAAHAFAEAGWQVDIFSNKRRSEMYGAQYLHRPIPGLLARKTVVTYDLLGTKEEYRLKVYGPDSGGILTSPEELKGQHMAWDIRAAYWDAWDRYADLITHAPNMNHDDVRSAVLAGGRYQRVVSSLPAHALCGAEGQHRFVAQKVWAVGDAPERGVFCPIPCDRDLVLCNGQAEVGWYRVSNVFGYRTAEWPDSRKPPVDGLAAVHKPLYTDCSCLPDVVRVGRYGTWTKGVLSHEAYETARRLAR